MKRRVWSVVVCLVIALAALYALPVAVIGDYTPHTIDGDVGAADSNDPANWANATIYNVDNASLQELYMGDLDDADPVGGYPAYWFYDVVDWNWSDGQDVVAVFETRPGLNGFAGTVNWTSSTDDLLDVSLNVQDFPAAQMERIPAITPTFGVDMGVGYINLNWTGLADANANVVNYTVYESFNGAPESVVGYSGAQVSSGAMTFNRTGITVPGQYCYNMAVNYRRGATFYTTIGRSNTVCLNGTGITGTFPSDGQTGVAFDQFILVNFSSAMDTTPGTMLWSISPDPGGWTEAWQLGNTTANLTHSRPFAECTWYNVTIQEAYDAGGNPVLGLPYSFTFQTVCLNPMISDTNPSDSASGVPVTRRDIWVNFTEPMNISTVTWSVSPDGWSSSWQNNNTTLVLSHAGDLAEITTYMAWITAGNDTDGLPLVPNPLAPNPWNFTTEAIPPTVVSYYPLNNQQNVSFSTPIYLNFSEPMNTTSVIDNLSINPSVGGLSYNWVNDQNLTVTHNLFTECTWYTVILSGAEDKAGVGLVFGLGFTFETICIAPTVLNTYPLNTSTDIPLGSGIHINFSEPMDTSTFNWQINPNPGGWTTTWTNLNQSLALTHSNPYTQCTRYHFNITSATDEHGVPLDPTPYSSMPYYFSFWANCTRPIITDHSPTGNNVPLTADIWVNFSRAMNQASVQSNFTISPSIAVTFNWPSGDSLRVAHAADFEENTTYTVTVQDGEDILGNTLSNVPHSWSFITLGIPPTVTNIYPANNSWSIGLGSGIYINFSEPMDTSTFNWQINPNPGGWTTTWTNLNQSLALTHSNPYTECTKYRFDITLATDEHGVRLMPYYFVFTTLCNEPYVTSTVPANGATKVAVDQTIIITFSEPMDIATVSVSILPSVTLSPPGWGGGNALLYLNHSAFQTSTVYDVTVLGNDTDGNPLNNSIDPGKNPFSFTTISSPPTVNITYPTVGLCCPGGGSVSIWFNATDDITPVANLTYYMNYTSSAGDGTIVVPPVVPSSPFLWTVPFINADDVRVEIVVIDEDGLLANDTSGAFRVDSTAPDVSSTTPTDGATNVPVDEIIVINFTEEMDHASVVDNLTITPVISLSPTWDGWNLTIGHSDFSLDTTYTVSIDTNATDVCGNPLAADVTFTFTSTAVLTPKPPQNLRATEVKHDKVSLAWDEVTEFTNGDTIGETVTYTVYRSATSGGAGTNIGTTTSTTLTDHDVNPETTYYYTVTATVAGRESARSNELPVTTPKTPALVVNWLLWIIVIIVIIVIILVILALLLRRKPAEEEEEIPPPVAPVVEEEVPPEEVPPEEVTPEEEAPSEFPPEEAVGEEVPERAVEAPAAPVVVPPAAVEEEAKAPKGKTCPNCGTIVGEDDTVCFVCGAEL